MCILRMMRALLAASRPVLRSGASSGEEISAVEHDDDPTGVQRRTFGNCLSPGQRPAAQSTPSLVSCFLPKSTSSD